MCETTCTARGGGKHPLPRGAGNATGSRETSRCEPLLPLQAYSRDVLSFIFLVLTAVNLWKAPRKYKAADLLNRQQTDEWKGWMQVRAAGKPGASWAMLLLFRVLAA